MSGQTFADKLNALVSLEVSRGTIHDPTAMSNIIESLASALGFTAALAAHGEPDMADHLVEGATAYVYEVAVERAPLAKMIAAAKAMSKPDLPTPPQQRRG
jgi:hypothetical protein